VEGKIISTLMNGYLTEGNYKYEFDGTNLPSGISYCCFSDNNKIISTNKLILLK